MKPNRLSSTVDSKDDALSAIIARLVEAYEPKRIYLFGSVARGDGGPDSDYDIMVIVADDATPARRRSRLAYEALWSLGRAGDILVMTERQFESRACVRASLAATIQDEGKVLYER